MNLAVTSIQPSELERIAHRIWYAGASKAWWFSNHVKHASFETMGFADDDVVFPMRSREWVLPVTTRSTFRTHWGGLGVIRVRRSTAYRYRTGAKVRFANGGVDPLRVLERTMRDDLPEYTVQSKSLNIFHVREWEIEPYHEHKPEDPNSERT